MKAWGANAATAAANLGIAIVLLLGGCAAAGRDDAAVGDAAPISVLVATDMIGAIMQLPELSPFSTTVQLEEAVSPFGEALMDGFRQGGYGVQRVTLDQGRRFVRYAVRTIETGAEESREYTLRIGADIEARRRYRMDGDRWRPVGAMWIRGVEPVRVVVNDDIYRQEGASLDFPSGVVFLGSDGERLLERTHVARVGAGRGRVVGERIGAERFLVMAKANLYLVDRLAGPEEIGTYRPVLQVSARFSNASGGHLGVPNKRALALLRDEALVGDRVIVTGCSHGESLLWDGTESAALERSQRVKEELVLGGMAPRQVIEEGCFATRYADKLGPETVVVTLERPTAAAPPQVRVDGAMDTATPLRVAMGADGLNGEAGRW